jgi:hypothetical protein
MQAGPVSDPERTDTDARRNRERHIKVSDGYAAIFVAGAGRHFSRT